MSSNIKNLSGKRFGKLTVKEDSGERQSRAVMWKCVCDCGNVCVVRGSHLISGKTKSCGCYNSELVAMRSKARKHISEFPPRLRRIWRNMKQRCNNPAATNYHNYGARGIKVSDEWNSFQTFAMWAVNNGYDDTLTLDRKNNNGNYEPSNCRWATWKEQAHNKRKNKKG